MHRAMLCLSIAHVCIYSLYQYLSATSCAGLAVCLLFMMLWHPEIFWSLPNPKSGCGSGTCFSLSTDNFEMPTSSLPARTRTASANEILPLATFSSIFDRLCDARRLSSTFSVTWSVVIHLVTQHIQHSFPNLNLSYLLSIL